jgi:exopolyphosphatase/guanosine-5'-triphosphate,3'-diphosphate pyrophosphatase
VSAIGPEIRASIDIGSNSVLLLLAEYSPFKELAKLSEVTGLGKGLDKSGMFAEGPLGETYNALKKYADVCQQHGLTPDKIIATATEASRVARNAPAFYQRVREELGINVQIITGKGEAALTTKGILFNTQFNEPEVVVMDIGGASTEFIRVDTQSYKIIESVSLKVGAVRTADWLKEGSFDSALGKIFSDHSAELDRYQTRLLQCVAGTLTSLGNMHLGNKDFVEDEVHGMTLKASDIDVLYQRCGMWTPEQFVREFPFLGKRSDAIRGGLMLTTHLLKRLKVESVVISTYGLRYGTFLEGKVPHEYLA